MYLVKNCLVFFFSFLIAQKCVCVVVVGGLQPPFARTAKLEDKRKIYTSTYILHNHRATIEIGRQKENVYQHIAQSKVFYHSNYFFSSESDHAVPSLATACVSSHKLKIELMMGNTHFDATYNSIGQEYSRGRGWGGNTTKRYIYRYHIMVWPVLNTVTIYMYFKYLWYFCRPMGVERSLRL